MTIKMILSFFLALAFAWPLAANPSVQEIIDTIDARYEMKSDITAKSKITTKDPDLGGIKIIEGVLYRRDSDDAFLMVQYAPDSDKGNGYLRVGDNFWMYLSKSRSFTHIGRGEKISGSNATAGDFETRKFKELYKPALDANGKEIFAEEMIGKIPVFKLELTAKVVDVKYPKLVLWLTRDKLLSLKEEYYSLSGTLLETHYNKNYKEVDGRYIALITKIDDAIQKDNVTIMEIQSISFSQVDDFKFDKRYLESLSK
jgi:hypothetical protein